MENFTTYYLLLNGFSPFQPSSSRQVFCFFPKKAVQKLHIFMTRLKCFQQKLTFQTIEIQCALSPDRSKGTDQIHLVQHSKMLYTVHRNV